LKLTGPRHLHPSQYGYFCTNETPGGSSIGITKNFSIMTHISTTLTNLNDFITWLRTKGQISLIHTLSHDLRVIMTPVYLNGGILGYTINPETLVYILRLLKHTGFLPYSTSITFNIRTKRVLIYVDEGRPLRPLIKVKNSKIDIQRIVALSKWRDLIIGTHPLQRGTHTFQTSLFIDPLNDNQNATFKDYIKELAPHVGPIEYVDPYEQNETYIANFIEHIKPETTHLEVHPSTILSILTSMIPFPNHNQSPRNQLSDSQSKQGVSLYTSNWNIRFDNTAHVLCYGETPLSRTIYTDYLGEGRMPYGQNILLAIASYTGYNQEDGIVINRDALERGLFRTLAYKSYEVYEEDDDMAKVSTRFGNPAKIITWNDIRPGNDYSKLDDNGLIKVGEYVDENTVIVGAYMMNEKGEYKDASITPQVWTSGRVESVVTTINNVGLKLIKIRVAHDRIPVLGDKFSNRHGQKGTIGMIVRGCDMPRTENGLVPDMIMNPHAIPSRMTMGQILEQLLGKLAIKVGSLGDATAFMNEGSPVDQIGSLLETFGMEKYGNQVLYNGMTGEQIKTSIFIGEVYGMRLKHMVEDKWQARGKGRREQRTHQPTGGRGNQGGLKIGEQERDSISAHGTSLFLRESFMNRSDGTTFPICIGCGTIPIYNESINVSICPLCDGPVKYSGNSVNTFEIIPPVKKQTAEVVKVEIPYSAKVLEQELATYMNISMRFITARGVDKIRGVSIEQIANMVEVKDLKDLKERELPEINISEIKKNADDIPVEELEAMAKAQGLALVPEATVEQEGGIIVEPITNEDSQKELMIGAEAQGLEGPIDEDDFEEYDIQLPQTIQNIPKSFSPLQSSLSSIGTIYSHATQAAVHQSPIHTQQIQGITQPQPMTEIGPATSSAGPTLVIDTSPNAMASMGLPPIEETITQILPPLPSQQQQQPRQRTIRSRNRFSQQQPTPNSMYIQGGYSQQQQQQQQQQQPQREFSGIPQGYSGSVAIKKLE
jgi:DNA-directed RNA polymerase II subunit RPB2